MLSFIDTNMPKYFHPCLLVMEYLSAVPQREKPMKLSLQGAADLREMGVHILRKLDWALIYKQLIDIT